MEQDWRFNGQEEYLKDVILYKVVFPAFWEKAYIEKNMFFKKFPNMPKTMLLISPIKKSTLKEKGCSCFGTSIANFAGKKQ